MTHPLSRLVHFVFRLLFWLLAAVAMAGLVAAALLALAFSLIKALITGRPATVTVLFKQFRHLTAQKKWPADAPGASSFGKRPVPVTGNCQDGPLNDIVDVEVREIRQDRR